MKLGFVVLNWNGRRQLERGLGSVVTALRESDFCIVVDNASCDGSTDWVRANYPEVELVELDRNRRFAGGNNAGVRRALERGADAVVLVNNDTVVDSNVAEVVDDCLHRDPRVGLVGLRIVYDQDPTRIWYGGGRLDLRWGLIRHRALRRAVDGGHDPEGETDWVTGCFLAGRAELWQQLQGLDEGYYIYSEDVDFCRRARQAGWSLHYCPRGCLRHDVSATVGGSRSPFKVYHKVRSRWQLFARHGLGVLWPLGVLATDLVDLVGCLLAGSPAAARAVIDAWIDAGPGRRPMVRHSTDELQ